MGMAVDTAIVESGLVPPGALANRASAVQTHIGSLLEIAGARIRGRSRADCPRCKRFRAISFTSETFFCHGIDCGWKGNTVSLEKELGIYRRIPSAEYRELRRRSERAHEAAVRLYSAAHSRQLELREELRLLGRAELRAHEAGPDDPDSWEILAYVYQLRPTIERELEALEADDPAFVLARRRNKGDMIERCLAKNLSELVRP